MWVFVSQAHLAWRQQSLNNHLIFMAISTLTAAALISGGNQIKGQIMKIKLLRNIYIDSKMHEVGETLEVNETFGFELIASNKAEKVQSKESKKAEKAEKTEDTEASN